MSLPATSKPTSSATERPFRRFLLQRKKDVSGISGTGFVAQGVQFWNGKCVMCWHAEGMGKHAPSSMAVYDSVDELIRIHGHDGATKIKWIDDVRKRYPWSSNSST